MIANQGLEGFVDALLNSQEYLEAFGLETLPYQRSRVLAGHAKPQLPFNQHAPRYNAYWRDASARRAPANPFGGGGAQFSGGQISAAWVGGQPPKSAQTIRWPSPPSVTWRCCGCCSPRPAPCLAPALPVEPQALNSSMKGCSSSSSGKGFSSSSGSFKPVS